MQKLTWINANGDSVDLTSGNYGITEWNGFSNTGLNIQSQQVPFHDGGVFLDALIEQRDLSVTLAMQDNKDLELRYRLRRELIEILNPKMGEGYLVYQNEYTAKRIKCVPQIPLFPTHNSNDTGTPKASLVWTACEPYWEDLEETEVDLTINEDKIVINQGDIPCNIKAKINTRYVENMALRNITTEERIVLNGVIDTPVSINTEMGVKSVHGDDDLKMKWLCGGVMGAVIEDDKDVMIFGNNQVLTINEKGEENLLPQTQFIEKTCKVLYHNGIYVMGNIGYGVSTVPIQYSTDAKTWHDASFVVGTNLVAIGTVYRIVYCGSLFIAVGVGGDNRRVIMTSPDGITWTSRLSDYNGAMTDVCYSPKWGIYLAVGAGSSTQAHPEYGNCVYKSSDGISWTATGLTDWSNCAVCWSKLFSKFYMMSGTTNKALYESTDGTTWSLVSTGGSLGTGITYNGKIIEVNSLGIVICFLLTNAKTGMIITKFDGLEWTRTQITGLPIVSSASTYISDFIYSSVLNKFVICGSAGILYSTKDGEELQSFGTSLKYAVNSIIYHDGYYYCSARYGDNGTVARSLNGRNWEWRVSSNLDGGVTKIFWSNTFEKFYVCGDKASSGSTSIQVAYSSNWNTWHAVPAIVGTYLSLIAESDTMLLVGGYAVLKTTDGTTFERLSTTMSSSEHMNSLCYFPKTGLFYANISGDLRTSADGATWTTTGTTHGTSYLTVINGKMFASDGVSSAYTEDGENWFVLPVALGTSISYDSELDLYMATYSGGQVAFSQDLINWQSKGEYLGELVTSAYNPDLKQFITSSWTSGGVSQDEHKVFATEFTQGVNLISRLSPNSNMNFTLKKGENLIRFDFLSGRAEGKLTYRQKYIGV